MNRAITSTHPNDVTTVHDHRHGNTVDAVSDFRRWPWTSWASRSIIALTIAACCDTAESTTTSRSAGYTDSPINSRATEPTTTNRHRRPTNADNTGAESIRSSSHGPSISQVYGVKVQCAAWAGVAHLARRGTGECVRVLCGELAEPLGNRVDGRLAGGDVDHEVVDVVVAGV